MDSNSSVICVDRTGISVYSVQCEIIKDKSYFFARKERKVLFPLVFHAGAEEVANFVTTRERKAGCVRLDYQRIRQIERNSCCLLDSNNTVAKTCHFQLSIFILEI